VSRGAAAVAAVADFAPEVAGALVALADAGLSSAAARRPTRTLRPVVLL